MPATMVKRPSDAEVVKVLRELGWFVASANETAQTHLPIGTKELALQAVEYSEAIQAASVGPTQELRAWAVLDSLNRIGRVFPLDDYRGGTNGEKSKAAQADAKDQSGPNIKLMPLYSNTLPTNG